MPRTHDSNCGAGHELPVATHPQNGRRVVDFAQTLRILETVVRQKIRTDWLKCGPLSLGHSPRFAIEEKLRSLCGKLKRLEFGERDLEDLARGCELFHHIDYSAWAQTWSQRESKPPQLIFHILCRLRRSFVFGCAVHG